MKYDKQLVGFTGCLFVISFLLLFGIETRYFIFFGSGFISGVLPVFIFLVFLFSALYISRVQQNRVAFRPQISIKGKKKTVQYVQVDRAVRNYIINRAKLLNIPGSVSVTGLPSTYNLVDAYVFGSGKNHTVVLTGGAQALYLRRDERDLSKFFFMVDHELGHIKGQDTGILYFAKSTLLSILFLLPLKFVLIYFIAIQYESPVQWLEKYYSTVYPVVQRDFFANSFVTAMVPTLTTKPLPFVLIVLFTVIFSILMGFMLFFFYKEILRRREFLADRFALEKGQGDTESIAVVMQSLLNYRSMKQQPPQGFKSNTSFHPSAADRVQNIIKPTVKELPSAVAVICALGICFSFHFCYGNTIQYADEGWDTVLSHFNLVSLVLMSGVFCVLLGLVFDHLINSSQKSTKLHGLGTLIYLVVWAFVIATVYQVVYQSFNFTSARENFDFTGNAGKVIDSLKRLATTGTISMVFSMPLTVLCFGLSFYLLPQFWKAGIRKPRTFVLFQLSGITLSIGLLALINYPFQTGLHDIQTGNFNSFVTAQREWGMQKRSHNLFGNESEDEKSKNRQEDSSMAQYHILVQRHNYEESEKVFFPPLCFVALWQTPFDPSIYHDSSK